MDTLKKIRGSLLVDNTEIAIFNYIKETPIPVGQKLPNEFELAEMFGVGRSTIREAVKALSSKNVVSIRQGSGTYVKSHTASYFDPLGLSKTKDKLQLAHDLISVRIMLEPEIAGLAAENATPEEIEQIEMYCNEVERLIKEGNEYQDSDIMFHSAIAKASRNIVVKELIPIIDTAILIFVNVTHRKLIDETIRTHRLILDAIKHRDSLGAKHAMLMHLMYNWDSIEENRRKV